MKRVLSLLRLIMVVSMAVCVPCFAQEAETGQVRTFIFSHKGRPMKGVAVKIGTEWKVTSSSGKVLFELSPGEYRIKIKHAGREVAEEKARVVKDNVTEVIGTLNSTGNRADVEIEEPETGAAEAGTEKKDVLKGVLTGSVTDAKEKKPVPEVYILVKGVRGEAKTNNNGQFSFELPSGTHTVSFICEGYAKKTMKDVSVPPKGEKSISIELQPSTIQFKKYTFTEYTIDGGTAVLIDEKRDAATVTDIIGAEQISKTGDSDAASALKRATGLTVVGGKYVYVRGMGERYSSSLLNGASLPSPEPEKRVVPLDIFPVDVIESLQIQKAYTADMPGEFGGGAVNIRTKEVPDDFFSLSLSGAFVEDTTFSDGLTYDGGGLDWIGADDGTRSLPGSVAATSNPIIEQSILLEPDRYTAAQLEEFGEDMPNRWSPREEKYSPNYGFSATVGDEILFNDNPFHYMVSIMYDRGAETIEREMNFYSLSGSSLIKTQDYTDVSTTEEIKTSGLLDLGYKFNERHSLRLTSLVVRTTKDTARQYRGYYESLDATIFVNELNWQEQMLVSNGLSGEHILPFRDIGLDWRYTYSFADRKEPDQSEIMYAYNETREQWYLESQSQPMERMYSELDENNHDLGMDLTIPFSVATERNASVKTGFAFMRRHRDSNTRRFQFVGITNLNNTDLYQPPENIFTPTYIGPTGLELREITKATDSYEANHNLYAGYVMVDWPVLSTLDLNIGARIEKSEMTVDTFNLFNPDDPISTELDDTDVLPGLNVTWKFYKDMQIRTGYSRTLARPNFLELSETEVDRVVGAGIMIGNPDLKRTIMDNFDLRWEWYFTADENVSVAFFYKNLYDPIELIIVPGANRVETFQNVDSARNLGFEIEFRKNFAFITQALRDLYIAGNFTYIQSKVSLGDDVGATTEDERPLFGQSPYVINLSLNYDNPETKKTAAIVYNVFGERIVGVGAEGLPDEKERPFHQLDLVAGTALGKGWTMKAKIKNILGEEVEIVQEGRTREKYEKPREYSLSFSWSF